MWFMKKDRDRAKARRATPADAEVGKRIRERRLELGLSQAQLGDLIGVTFQQIQKYELGINRIGASRLGRAADALQVKVNYFFDKQSMIGDSQFFNLTSDEIRLVRALNTIRDGRVRRLLLELVEEFLTTEEGAASST
jgi:transcriptional regulator with XRE-family HTH domain